jgi:hypothetical protein
MRLKFDPVTLSFDLENQYRSRPSNGLSLYQVLLSPLEGLEPYWFSRSYVKGKMSHGQIFTSQYSCEHSRINTCQWILTKLGTYIVLRRVWNLLIFKGKGQRVKFLPHNILVNTLESKSFKWHFSFDIWPWKSIGFQTLQRTKHLPSLVKIHWRILILECSQGCCAVKIWPGDLHLWPWKSVRFQTLLRTNYVPSLVKIHWRILILDCSQGCYAVKIWPGDLDLWPCG